MLLAPNTTNYPDFFFFILSIVSLMTPGLCMTWQWDVDTKQSCKNNMHIKPQVFAALICIYICKICFCFCFCFFLRHRVETDIKLFKKKNWLKLVAWLNWNWTAFPNLLMDMTYQPFSISLRYLNLWLGIGILSRHKYHSFPLSYQQKHNTHNFCCIFIHSDIIS